MSEQSALRRLPRPTQVITCHHCAAALGTNYPTCPVCTDAFERHWLADWHALLEQEQIAPKSADEQMLAQIVFAEGECHMWTVLDIALTLLTCPSCGHELGGGPPECTECASAWGVTLWAETVAGRSGLVTMNEHALHVGRMILRHRHRQSANIIAAWSRTMPRLLTGWLPSTPSAQHYMRQIKAGQLAEVDAWLADLDRTIGNTVNENTRER